MKLLQSAIYLKSFQTQETAIHYCAKSGNYDIAKTIFEYLGATKTMTAINRLAKVMESYMNFTIILKNIKDILVISRFLNFFQNGSSGLLIASEQGHIETVKIFLSFNARVDVFEEVRKFHEKINSTIINSNTLIN